jgi:hypothetical protein
MTVHATSALHLAMRKGLFRREKNQWAKAEDMPARMRAFCCDFGCEEGGS